MKRLNLKLVIGLIAVVSVLAISLVWAHSRQAGNDAETLKQRGDAALKEEQREKALDFYHAALRQVGSDPDLEEKCGVLAERVDRLAPSQSTFTQAFQSLHQSLRSKPDSADVHRSLAELLMRHGLFSEATEQLKWLTEQPGSHDPRFNFLLVQSYARQDYYDKAVVVLANMIGYEYDPDKKKFTAKPPRFPTEVLAYRALAAILRENIQPPQTQMADTIMDRMVLANPNSFKAYLERSKYANHYKGLKAGDDDLAAAVKLQPDSSEVILAAAETALAERKLDDCEKFVARGLKLFPQEVLMYRQYALLKNAEGKPAEALKKIEEGLKQLPGNPTLIWELAELKLEQRDLDGARQTLKSLAEYVSRHNDPHYNKPLLDLMEARILFYQGRWLQASQEFERLRPALTLAPDQLKQADLFASQCYERLGEYDKQLEACRHVLAVDPSSLVAQAGVASALMAAGQTKDAQEAYQRLASHLKDETVALTQPQIWVPIAQLWISQQLSLAPKDRRWDNVDRLLKRLADANKTPDATLAVLQAEVEFHKGNLAASSKVLTEAREKFPQEPLVWTSQAALTMQQQGPEKALAELDAAPAGVNAQTAVRLTKAALLARVGGDKAKAALLALEAGADKLPVADRTRLWVGLGSVYLDFGQRDDAKRLWQQAAALNPDDVNLRIDLFDLGRESDDEPLMASVLDQVRQLTGKTSAESRFLEATRITAQIRKKIRDKTPLGKSPQAVAGDDLQLLHDARKLLDEVAQARPNWYRVDRSLGDLALLEGDIDSAISSYKHALQVGPADPTTVRALVLLLSQQHRTDEMQAALDKLSPEKIAEVGLTPFSISNKVEHNQFDDALADATRVVTADSPDPQGHMWLGSLYDRAGKPKEAEDEFRRAVKTGAEIPDTWLVLVDFLIRQNRIPDAGKALLDARRQLPEDRVNQVLGPGYEAIGMFVEAEQYYQAAIEAAPNDATAHRLMALFYLHTGRTDPLRRELLKVLDLSEKDPREQANLIWSRRILADLLATDGDYADFLKAKRLLASNIKLTGPQGEDLLRLANLLSGRSDEPASWREAVALLESVKSLSLRDQLTLARLRDLTGDWSDARRDMLALVSQPKTDSAVYGVFVDMLLEHNEVVDAESWLDRLDQVQPAAALLLRAQVAAKQGHPEEAANMLKRMLPSGPLPPDQLPRLRAIAQLMEQQGMRLAAEEMYRRYMAAEPGPGALLLAQFLGRNGRIDEALDLCDDAFRTETVVAVLDAAYAIAHAEGRKVSEPQLERMAGWYRRALRDDSDSPALILRMADFQELRGNHAEAEKLYRDALARKDLTPMQRAIGLNNLAFLLANQRKDLPEALAMTDQAAALLGPKSDILDTRGMVHLAMDDVKSALADFKDAALVADASALKLLHLAAAQLLSGDKDGAQSTFRRAREQKLGTAGLSSVERELYDRLTREFGS